MWYFYFLCNFCTIVISSFFSKCKLNFSALDKYLHGSPVQMPPSKKSRILQKLKHSHKTASMKNTIPVQFLFSETHRPTLNYATGLLDRKGIYIFSLQKQNSQFKLSRKHTRFAYLHFNWDYRKRKVIEHVA